MMNMDNASDMKPKGSAIPGLDYGIDMLDEAPGSEKSTSPPPAAPRPAVSQLRQQLGNINIQAPQMQQQRFNFKPNVPRFQEESYMEGDASLGSGDGGSFHSSMESGSGMEESEGSGGLLPPGFEMPEEPQAPLSYEQRRERKINALAALRRLEEAGYVPAGDKKFSFATDLGELEEAVERLKLQRDLDSSIKFQRKFLIGFANVVEFVCSTEYNIFDLKLEGWSDSIFENITDYDEVFEELYYKYKDSVAVAPEIKLVMMVGGSAMMFHMSREIFSKTSSKVPGFDEVMARDPELKRRYTDVAAGIAKDRGMPMPSKQDGGAGFIKSMFNETMNKAPAQVRKVMQPQQSMPIQNSRGPSDGPRGPPPSGRPRVPMSEPDDIDGLLGSLTGSKRKGPSMQDEIDLSEIENLSDLA